MSANRNWGDIRSGATFEALATTLVFFEDSKAALFGRRGPDGGQDARSGDGLLVFQAKHHENGSAAKAIADAKKEAAKIERYRDAAHKRYEQWKGVTKWRLVTNAEFNPTSNQQWKSEVVPMFAKIGLEASYWERANLDALLDSYPEVSRAFFKNSTRALLTLPEVRERISDSEPFLQREPGAFVGRDADLGAVSQFVTSDKLFLVLHGPGGVGKTRLMLEAGANVASDGQWQVLWANTATMSRSDSWFTGVIPERPTVLLVDEPEDENLLQVLAEQLGTGRTSKWKVVVAVRSPKDPVLRFLSSARMQARCTQIAVAALPPKHAAEMCLGLLRTGPLKARGTGDLEHISQELAARFATYPIWLTLAVHLLETRGDLNHVPNTAERLASEYLEEIINQQKELPAQCIETLLRWVALLAPFNRHDDAAVSLVAEDVKREKGAVLEALARLVARRALSERGANTRLVEFKPDVMRDHALLTWLVVPVDTDGRLVPSDAARKLLASIAEAVRQRGLNAIGKRSLVAIARTEMLLRLSDRDVDILGGFFEPLHTGIAATPAIGRIAIADAMQEIAYVRPMDVVRLSRLLRESQVDEQEVEGLFGIPIRKGIDDVVLSLAWSVYHAAIGASSHETRRAVLQELFALAELEEAIGPRRKGGLPNDGKRAGQLVDRAIQGGPEFWGNFEEVAEELAVPLVREALVVPLTAQRSAALRALLHALLAVARKHMWSEGPRFTIRRFLVVPGEPAWEIRHRLRRMLHAAIESATCPIETKQVFWKVLVESHRSANQERRQGRAPTSDAYRDEVRGDLLWAEAAFSKKAPRLEELVVARDLWDWHRRFDPEAELKAIAVRLEDFYLRDSLAGEFEPLVSWDTVHEQGERAEAKSRQLAAAADGHQIADFVRRGARFLGSEVLRLQEVAWRLGLAAPTSGATQAFVHLGLRSDETALQDFASVVGRSWVVAVRQSAPEGAARLLQDLVSACASDGLRARFVLRVFGPPQDSSTFTTDEHRFLRRQIDWMLSSGEAPTFLQATAWTLEYEWHNLRPPLERAVAALTPESVRTGLDALVDSVFWAARDEAGKQLPEGLGTWLLDQLIVVSDFDQIGDNVDWRLQEIFKRVPPPGLPWLLTALQRRRAAEREEGQLGERFRAVGNHSRLSRYVRRIEPNSVASSETIAAVRDLVAFVHDEYSVGYDAPRLLADVDPDGLLVPSVVATEIASASDERSVVRLARIAGEYAIGGPSWRCIARAALLSTAVGMDKRRLFSALESSRPRSWSGAMGEVPPVFEAEVLGARARAASETDPVFAPFWSWQVVVAEAELKRQVEQAREERGE